MLAQQRYRMIADILQRQESATTADLAEELDVSAETVRRDLVYLEQEGKLVRIHGGAARLTHDLPQEASYPQRLGENARGKETIGALAAALVQPKQTIVIDLGTTALRVAMALPQDFDGVVATNSLLVANALAENSKAEVQIAPGKLRRGDMCVSGIATYRFFQSFYADLAFIGVGGVNLEHGVTDFYREECEIKQAIMSHSRRSYVLADSTKIGNTARYSLCDFAEIAGVITENALDEPWQAVLGEAGCELITP